MTPEIQLFRERLRATMRRRGVSQTRLGQELGGLHRSTVARWLKPANHLMIDSYQMMKAAQVLGVSTRWLLGVTDIETPPEYPTDAEGALLRAYRALDVQGQAAMIEMALEAAETLKRAASPA